MADAYITGLTMLAHRELSEAQVRQRLARRQFETDDIDAAVARLRANGSLDDRRTALAFARTQANVKRHGRLRVLRELQTIGIARGLAQDAVAEVFADVDEDALIARALDRRLRTGRGTGASRPTLADLRRVQQYLLRQGFSADRVNAAIRDRRRESSE
ncbi:MAG: hypothetical protein A3F70_00550 [Acidobacteria bacterium RIFCSPLOWO2_12_FULL_67_14]|nr:MAG: hypothetical protein A3F70_00550 [Acidobacteria bacterium RIFCSPLOWO2_12_FULL_67_14]